jgi:4'-phosphopantetheinyl transferase
VTERSDESRAGGQKSAEGGPREANRLPIDRVDVWLASLLETWNQPDPALWLSADERARGERFSFERDRRRFCRGRSALRAILASYLRCDPAEIVLAYGGSGKPRLEHPDTAIDLQFNASGSGDLAVCAVTCGRRVGIDIEQPRGELDPDLVRYALSEVERAELEQIPQEQQPTIFYRTWTRKEAYLKATGCGLSRPLASFAVALMPGEPPRLVRDDSTDAAHESWSFADYDPAPGWMGTVVHSGDPRPLRKLEWSG